MHYYIVLFFTLKFIYFLIYFDLLAEEKKIFIEYLPERSQKDAFNQINFYEFWVKEPPTEILNILEILEYQVISSNTLQKYTVWTLQTNNNSTIEKVKPDFTKLENNKVRTYEDVEQLLSKECTEPITLKNLQFYVELSEDTNQSIINAIIKGQKDPLKAKKDAIRLWHPDKFSQMFSDRIPPIEKNRIDKFVHVITQALLSIE